MAHVLGSPEERQKFKNSLQIGDYVSLLGTVYKWEKEDYENEYGEDLNPIFINAIHLTKNGFTFDISNETLMKRVYRDNIIIYWNPKTRDLTYSHGAFTGGVEKVDTMDKFQKALRLIGLIEVADNFNPNS